MLQIDLLTLDRSDLGQLGTQMLWQGRFVVNCFGGRGRDRTGDPLLAKQVLSQLSYTPTVYSLDCNGFRI